VVSLFPSIDRNGGQHMTQNDPTNVFAAFEILLEEIEIEIDFINKDGARAIESRDYENAQEAIERGKKSTLLRDRVVDLRKDWEVLMATPHPREEEEHVRVERRNAGRLQRGIRTPETAFLQPILKALVELGGSARMNDVLNKVEQFMKGALKPADYESLPSTPDQPRWRNTAQWERNTMAREGLLKSNSPKGVWEISEQGRKALTGGRS